MYSSLTSLTSLILVQIPASCGIHMSTYTTTYVHDNLTCSHHIINMCNWLQLVSVMCIAILMCMYRLNAQCTNLHDFLKPRQWCTSCRDENERADWTLRAQVCVTFWSHTCDQSHVVWDHHSCALDAKVEMGVLNDCITFIKAILLHRPSSS